MSDSTTKQKPAGARQRPNNFTFDHVFEESISQDNLYCETLKPLVLSCLDGYNATVFAYGQTGMR